MIRATRQPDKKVTLENKSEGELHLPPSLLAGVSRKLARVVEVPIRERTIHAVQHVVSREAKLNIESFTDRRDGEVFVQRRVPVKLWPASENVPAQRTDLRRRRTTGESIRIACKDSRRRTSKRIAIELQALVFLRLRRIRIADEINAPAITRNVEYRTSLPGDDVVELPATDNSIETFVHVRAITSVTPNR